MNKKSLVVLISGSGSNLQAIIDAIADKQIDATISAVISNRPSAYGLERATKANIRTIVIDHTEFAQREYFDIALCKQLDKLKPDLIALAGFMRILSDGFIEQYKGKILNIHPSLLPEFKGIDTHRRVIEAGKPLHGASVHFVDNELDSGPIVLQAELSVHNDDVETLEKRVLEQEHVIYPLAIQWFFEGRLRLSNNQVFIDNKFLEHPARWVSNKLTYPGKA